MNPKTILVAGDVCLDVMGILVPPQTLDKNLGDNWRLTGERQIHFMLGGAMLVTEFMEAANPGFLVNGPRACLPPALSANESRSEALSSKEFLEIAERLRRDEVVHSLLELDYFRPQPDAKKAEVMRVLRTHGFSGPKTGDPSLELQLSEHPSNAADIIVLDDTGNRFRRSPKQWPSAISRPETSSQAVIVHKLHCPLPSTDEARNSLLWKALAAHPPERRMIIVSIDDLRESEAVISLGLSWERTAMDLIWQLLNTDKFLPLKQTSHLVVRLGLDGAVYWHRSEGKEGEEYHAWLLYDPIGIEGTGESACEGKMVGYGSVFTAALVQALANSDSKDPLAPNQNSDGTVTGLAKAVEAGIKSGLVASRRLLQLGFGKKGAAPRYPGTELFLPEPQSRQYFACQRIPIIPGAAVPDRGYWRLLDSIFANQTNLLHRAVAMTATGAKQRNDEDKAAFQLLRDAPMAVFAKALRTQDRREIENYRALYGLLLDYVHRATALRPLSIAVFGPPGAGKSFGVKMVAKALGQLQLGRGIRSLTFNLSQYKAPEELSDAFHLVRDVVLGGEIPLVFFDEFDTALGGKPLGWLRYFLSPMQDAQFLDRGVPHPIGQAIFIFAGGTFPTYASFARQSPGEGGDETKNGQAFKDAKGPDFLSRLRGTLDIPGLDLNPPFDPFGPVELFPSEASILLRRAAILNFQIREKAPSLIDADDVLDVKESVLRALLHLPQFEHGNRSFEALLDMSHINGAKSFAPSLLPAGNYTGLHANEEHLSQLLSSDYPFPESDRLKIAKAIHRQYQKQRGADPKHEPDEAALKDWDDLPQPLKQSNLEQADHIVVKLRAAGLWFRRIVPGAPFTPNVRNQLEAMLESLAKSEHDRWVAEKRRQGWIPANDTDRKSRNNKLLMHNFLFRWDQLPDNGKELDRGPVSKIPELLAAGGYELIRI